MESKVAEQEEEFRSPKYIFHGFMERLWAYLTIQQLLEKMVSASDAEKQALETQALGLSLNYSFVTPLTSMVVTKPEGQEQSQVAEKPVEDENENEHRRFYSRHQLIRNKGLGYRGPVLPGGSSADTYMHGRSGFRRQGPFGVSSSYPMKSGLQASVVYQRPFYDSLVNVYSAESMDVLETSPTTPPAAPIQAPAVILPLPGQSVDQLCVDIKHSQEPMNLLSDPEQGLEVTGQYEMKKAQFSWIKVTFKQPQLQVYASPEHVVVTRNQRNSEYKWKETLFSVMPGLKMTMDKEGLLLLSSPDKVTIGLLSWNGPRQGIRLLLQDTNRFSSHVNGTLGQFYQDVLWEPSAADDSKRTLRVQGQDHPATRELKLDYQQGYPGTEIPCWCVEL
nr:inter-alpha-trypsin inhibitor heavy chain 4 [Molossus molossus]